MKKKILLLATSVCMLSFLVGCSKGTYDKYVTLGDYKGLEINMIKSEVTEEMVDEEIESLIEDNASYTEITDRAVKEGDTVNIDFVGKIDNEEFDGGSASDFDLEVGSGYLLEDLETAMVGMKVGETKEIAISFPAEYDASVAGKEAVFTVTVNSLSEKKLPEYNDEFVSTISEYTTTAEYEDNLKAELLATQVENSTYTAGIEALQLAVSNAKIGKELPQDLYDTCKTQYDEMNQQYAEMFGMDVEDLTLGEEDTKSAIEEMVKEKMVATAIAEKEKLTVSDDEYKSYLNDNYEIYGFESAAKYEEAYTKESITEEILMQKIQDFLVEQAKVNEVTEDEYYEMSDDSDLEGDAISDEVIDLGDMDIESLDEDGLAGEITDTEEVE